jgi:alanine racemase
VTEAAAIVARTPGASGVREALIDLGAVEHNIAHLQAESGAQHVLAVVSSNAFGHGAVQVAGAARAAGASGLVVARPREAAVLRQAGIRLPIVAWQCPGPDDLDDASRYDVDVAVCDVHELENAARAGVRRMHLVPEIGGSLPGARHWRALCDAARRNRVHVAGVMGRVDCFDPEASQRLNASVEALQTAGIDPGFVHVCDFEPGRDFERYRQNTVRLGAALYGLSDRPHGGRTGLPALTLTAPVVAVKPVRAGEGVSYGYTYVTPHDTQLLLVPLGYGDGVPRRSGNIAHVAVGGVLLPVAGRVAMDAMMLDAYPLIQQGGHPAVGDIATVIGAGGWSAERWAEALGTTSLDIVSRLGPRISRIEA